MNQKLYEKFVSNVTLEKSEDANDNQKQKYKLNVTKGGTKNPVDPFLVTEWNDLKHVTEYKYVNIAHLRDVETNRRYGDGSDGNSTIDGGGKWDIVKGIKVQSGATYTLVKSRNDWDGRIFFFNSSGRCIEKVGANGSGNVLTGKHGWETYQFDAPTNPEIAEARFSYQRGMDSGITAMIIEGELTSETPYIPYNDDKGKIFIGKSVVHEFDSMQSGLKANTTSDAIRELAQKVSSAGKVETVNGVAPAVGTKNVVLQATPTFEQNNLKLNINGGTPETFASVVCMADGDADTIIASLNMN